MIKAVQRFGRLGHGITEPHHCAGSGKTAPGIVGEPILVWPVPEHPHAHTAPCRVGRWAGRGLFGRILGFVFSLREVAFLRVWAALPALAR